MASAAGRLRHSIDGRRRGACRGRLAFEDAVNGQPLRLVVERRDDHHRDGPVVLALTDGDGELPAVHGRHHQIEQDQARPPDLLERLEAFLAVGSRVHIIALELERQLEGLPDPSSSSMMSTLLVFMEVCLDAAEPAYYVPLPTSCSRGSVSVTSRRSQLKARLHGLSLGVRPLPVSLGGWTRRARRVASCGTPQRLSPRTRFHPSAARASSAPAPLAYQKLTASVRSSPRAWCHQKRGM